MKKSVIIKELLLVLVTVIWGLGFIAQLLGGDYLDTFSFNVSRNIVATITLIIMVALFDLRKKKKNKDVDLKKEWTDKRLWIGGILAGLALAFAMVCQQEGVHQEGAGKSGFLTALYIVFVPIINLCFGKKINVFVGIAIVLSLTGLYLINANGGEFAFSLGTILLLLCALGYSLQIIAIDKFGKGTDTIKFSLIQFGSAAISILPLALIFGEMSWDLFVQALPSILYLGVISSCVAYTLQIYAQTEVNVTIACIIMSLESVFSLIFGVICIHEKHGAIELIGCACIFIAVLLAQVDPKTVFKNKNKKLISKK